MFLSRLCSSDLDEMVHYLVCSLDFILGVKQVRFWKDHGSDWAADLSHIWALDIDNLLVLAPLLHLFKDVVQIFDSLARDPLFLEL